MGGHIIQIQWILFFFDKNYLEIQQYFVVAVLFFPFLYLYSAIINLMNRMEVGLKRTRKKQKQNNNKTTMMKKGNFEFLYTCCLYSMRNDNNT